jgi:DNA-directed RNA polymerase specialized sigma24 family protein
MSLRQLPVRRGALARQRLVSLDGFAAGAHCAQLPQADDNPADLLERFADESLQAHTALSVEQERELERLIASVARIDVTLAKILVLAIHEDMSNLEIARELNLPVRTVENGKKRLHRAVRKLYSDEDTLAFVQGGRGRH